MRVQKYILGPIALCILGACATTAPDPLEVCSAEWVQIRAMRAVDDIEKDAGATVRSLRSAAERYAQGRKPGPLQMFAISNNFKKLERELRNGRGVKDLKTLANTCDDPDIIRTAMTNFMREQGLNDDMIALIENFAPYRELLNEGLARAATPAT